MEKEKSNTEKSCWKCKYHNLGNDTLLGKCMWFVEHKNEEAKPIPANVVDKGCKLFVGK